MKNKKWFLTIAALLLILLTIPFFTVGAEEEEAEKITLVPAKETFELVTNSPNAVYPNRTTTAVVLKMEQNGEEFKISPIEEYEWFLTIKGGGEEKTLNITPYTSRSQEGAYYFDICLGSEDNRFIPTPVCTYALKLEIYKDGKLCYYSDLTENEKYICAIRPTVPEDPTINNKNPYKVWIYPSPTPWVDVNQKGSKGSGVQMLLINDLGYTQNIYERSSPDVKVTIYKTDGTGQPYTLETTFKFDTPSLFCSLLLVSDEFVPDKDCDYTIQLELTYETLPVSQWDDPTYEVYTSDPTPGFYLSEDYKLIKKNDPLANYLTATPLNSCFEYVGNTVQFSVSMKDRKGNPYTNTKDKWELGIQESGSTYTVYTYLYPISAKNGNYVFQLSDEQAAFIQPGKTYTIDMIVSENNTKDRHWLERIEYDCVARDTVGSNNKKPTDNTQNKDGSPVILIVAVVAVALIAVTGTVVFFAKKKKK